MHIHDRKLTCANFCIVARTAIILRIDIEAEVFSERGDDIKI